jgi:hypothetical protein
MRLLALAILPLAFAATAADLRETRAVGDFTEVSLSAPVDVHVTQGPAASLVLEGDAEALARIETVVESGRLKIRTRPRDHWSWNRKVTARLTAPRIEALAIAGSGDITAPALSGQFLRVSIAGSGDVRLGGKVDGFTASIAGSGDIRAGELEANDVKVSIAGSGDATVRAVNALAVNVSGSGDVRYFGEPTVRQSIAGSGSVRRARPASS